MKHLSIFLLAAMIALGGVILPGLRADSLPNDITSLEKLAKGKNEEAQLKLARKYIKGDGVAPDAKKAEKWLKKAAEEGSTTAQYELGKLYFDGIGGKPDYKNAIKWLGKAATYGNSQAQFLIGECFYYGFGEKQNYELAMEWFRRSSYTGYAPAEYMMGQMYANGIGTAQNRQEALECFRKAAEKGYREAQYALGVCYEEGLGVEKNIEEAHAWFGCAAANDDSQFEGMVQNKEFGLSSISEKELKAAEEGNAESRNRLGNMYYYGIGFPKNENTAISWFKKSADAGLLAPQSKLGSYYYSNTLIMPPFEEFGKRIGKISPEALQWWRVAARNGDSQSQLYLGIALLWDGTPSSVSEGFGLLKQSAQQGEPIAQYFLALCYIEGEGTDVDMEEAARWMKAASEQNVSAAEVLWGIMLYRGIGTPRNPKESVEWWKKASDQGNYNATMMLVDDSILSNKFSTAISWCKILDRQTGIAFGNHIKYIAGYEYFSRNDFDEAVKWFEAGAETGNANSMFMLGYCYNEGLGLPQSYKKAFELWSDASELNNQAATYYLGLCHQLGTGTSADENMAVRLYKKAADMTPYDGQMVQGSKETALEAALKLKGMKDPFMEGVNLNFINIADVYEWETVEEVASVDSIAPFDFDVISFTPDGHLVPPKYFPTGVDQPMFPSVQILAWLNYSKALDGDAKALFNLANFYYYGIDVNPNLDVAALLYSLAAQEKFHPAIEVLERVEKELKNQIMNQEIDWDDIEVVEIEEDY